MTRLITVAIAFIVTKPVNAANCKQACTDDYNPVCARATNGQFRLFSNKCEFDVESCEVPSAGMLIKNKIWFE